MIHEKTVTVVCPNCNYENNFYIEKDDFHLKRCQCCGLKIEFGTRVDVIKKTVLNSDPVIFDYE